MSIEEIIRKTIAEEFYKLNNQNTQQNQSRFGRYVKQKELKKEMGLNNDEIKKLEIAGLKRFKLQDGDRNVFYDRRQLDEVMSALAI